MPVVNPSEAAPSGCLLRLVWLVIGPLLLVASTGLVVRGDGISWRDGVLVAVAGLMIGARHLDAASGDETFDWKPSTPAAVRRYTAGVALLAAGLLALGHLAQQVV